METRASSCRPTNGAITVRGWEKDRYRLVFRKRLQSTDEEKAKEIAEEIVDLSTSEGELRAVARHFRNTSVSMELWLPKESRASIDVRSENGAIRLDDVSCREASVATTNGAINVSRVSGGPGLYPHDQWEDRLFEHTDGTCRGQDDKRERELGRRRAIRRDSHGERHGPARTAAARAPRRGCAHSERISEYDVSTVNGSVHVGLPDDHETGVSVVAHGRSVRWRETIAASPSTEAKGESGEARRRASRRPRKRSNSSLAR